MKILCETQVFNRQTNTAKGKRAAKSTLAIGYKTSAKDANGKSSKVLEMLLFTPQNKLGTRYKLHKNIEKMFTRFVQDGKLTISFIEPPENLLIKCEPTALKGFLKLLQMGLEGKHDANLRLNIAAASAIPQKSQPVLKLELLKASEYPPLKGFPKTLTTLIISGILLHRVGYEICALRNLTVLNLSCNRISKLPVELGRLSLQTLLLDSNTLGSQNCWQWLEGKALQQSLRLLDMSANQLSYFPHALVKLEQLHALKLNHNDIRRLPFALRRLRNLRFLHLNANKLESVPDVLNQMVLQQLEVWNNKFLHFQEHQLDAAAAVASNNKLLTPLWLQSLRAVSAYKLPCSAATLPRTLLDLLCELPKCACGKLCYRANILERACEATFDNVLELSFSRCRLIYSDIVLCGANCAGRKLLNT